jgi:hypothetical protein
MTGPEIVVRIEAVEALLRATIREGRDRPFVAIGRGADDLHRLAVDLLLDVDQ